MRRKLSLSIICLCLWLGLFATPALAADLTVFVSIDGSVTQVAAYSADQLAALGTAKSYYSSIDATGAPAIIAAEGVTINTLLSALSIPTAEVESLQFVSGDGWSKSYDFGSYSSGRYYYPLIVSHYDTEAAAPPEFFIGAEEEKTAVNAMLAIRSGEERFALDPAAISLTNGEGLRFCFGQSAITDAVSSGFGKYITSLTLVLSSGTSYIPAAADEETADPATDAPAQLPTPEKEEDANNGRQADSLTITVGYYGGPYYTKKVFTAAELDAMATVQQAYTFIDAMPAVVLDSVVGVPLADVLAAAGIDANSVETLHFYCSDVTKSWYSSMAKSYLLDTERYYYPYLPQRWDYENSVPLAYANEGAVGVGSVLAVEDNWLRFATEPDFDNLTSVTSFRLIFGQTDTSTSNASRSAKWVHTIEVMLGGTAPKGVTLDASALELEVGSRYQLTATVEKIDNTSDTRVEWSSSDESIVSVDSAGRISVLAEGEATVTATTVVGGLSASVTINGDGDTAAEAEAKPEDEQGEQTMFQLDGDSGAPTAGVQNWRVFEMSETAVELPELQTETPPLSVTLIVLGALLSCGFLGRLLIYRRQVAG